ncbi:MAG: hypothetical protein JRF63_14090 [Deltaproteobacteria bacterium]|nr:hypothetical protein [Deltaproteobacteria bacterium]
MWSRLKSAWIVLWLPIAISGMFSRTGNMAFRFSQAWTWVEKAVTGVRFEAVGAERADRRKSYIIISNHQSLYDIPALMLGLGLQFRWVIKKSLSFHPGPIQIVVGDPIDTTDYTTRDLKRLIERTRDAVIDNLDPDYPLESSR